MKIFEKNGLFTPNAGMFLQILSMPVGAIIGVLAIYINIYLIGLLVIPMLMIRLGCPDCGMTDNPIAEE